MAAEKILSAEAEAMFREGVGLVFSRWSALQMAVDNEWGGRNSRAKAEQLAADVFSWFTQAKPNEVRFAEDLEELLIEGISSLNVVADDGSIEEVAEELMYLHEDCEKGDFKPIEEHRKASRDRVPLPHVRVENENDNSDDDHDESDDPMVDAPDAQSNLNPVNMTANKPTAKPVAAAEDGWEVVAPRRNRERVMKEAVHVRLKKLPLPLRKLKGENLQTICKIERMRAELASYVALKPSQRLVIPLNPEPELRLEISVSSTP